jgi:F-type H+-transporting ATPase subunit b
MGDYSVTVLATGEGGTSNFLVPNGTFFFVLIIFLIVLGVIRVFVVPPVMRVLGERDAMVRKTIEDDKHSADEFAAAHADCEAAMSKARTEASGIRDETHAEGRRNLEQMRARASDEAAQALQQASEQLKQQADAIAANLRASVQRLSKTLASRILGVDRASSGSSAATRGQGGAKKTAASTASGR